VIYLEKKVDLMSNTFGMRRAPSQCPSIAGLKGVNSTPKMLGISLLTLCVVALAAPVAAASAGLVVTDPGTLVLLGMALVVVGACTRRFFYTRRKGL